MAWPTAQTVVAQAAIEVGLIGRASDLGDDVYDAVDSNIIQLLALLKKAGRDLVDEFEWQQLRAEWSITTVTGELGGDPAQRVGSYAMPPDWAAMLEQSGWNRTQRLPMGGPLSEQEWQYLASRLTGVVWTVLFRPMQGLLWLYPSTSTPEGQEITFGYKSANWVRPTDFVEGTDYAAWAADEDYKVGTMVVGGSAGDPLAINVYRCVQPGHSGATGPDPQLTATGVPTVSGSVLDGTCYWNWVGVIVATTNPTGTVAISTPSFGTKTEPESGEDVLMFDEQLLVAKLKLLWLDGKGFDTTSAETEYNRQFSRATSKNTSAPVLSLNGTGMVRDRLLGELNVPITGFGS